MTLNEIEQDVRDAPTMMSLEQEADFFRRLMELSVDDIDRNWTAFSRVLDRLYESHVESLFEINGNNKESFLSAAVWLESIAEDAYKP